MKIALKTIDIVVISLATRQDRRARISEALERENLKFKFFDAVPAPKEKPKGWPKSSALYGCRESHISVLENAKGPTLVFEDDADIPIGFAQKLAKLLDELPESWQVLRLGGDHIRPPQKISDNLVRSRGALYPHAYLVRYPEKLVNGARNNNKLDWGSYFAMQDTRKGDTFAPVPWLVNTTGSKSDIPDSVPIADRRARNLASFPSDMRIAHPQQAKRAEQGAIT